MAGRELIPLPSKHSDGDSEFWPQLTAYVHQPADRIYHEKLADLWMEYTKEGEKGIKYAFNALPSGYRVFTKARKSGLIDLTKTIKVDRYIFGHEKARFDSPNKFFEHFKYIIRNRTGFCTCINCSSCPSGFGARTTANSLISRPSSIQINGDDSFDVQFEDFIRICQSKANVINFKAWEGSYSSDMPTYVKSFDDIACNYRASSSFLPRRGELVIFYTNDQQDGRFEAFTQHFKLYDKNHGRFLGFPNWRAGVVVYEAEDVLRVDDLKPKIDNPRISTQRTYQIELYPDPDVAKKTPSNQTYYVTLDHIRPLNMFHEILSGLPQNKWHVTIHHALKVMCTLSIVDPMQFRGQWPCATIDCRGVWIGAELLVLGDAVRIFPPAGDDGSPIDEVLVIEGIEWRFNNLEAAGRHSSVFIRGKIYTTNNNKAYRPITTSFKGVNSVDPALPSSFKGYLWYSRSEVSNDDLEGLTGLEDFLLPVSSIIGRLYESKAMRYLLDVADFDVSESGIRQARSWAINRKQSQTGPGNGWALTTDRIEMLSIEKVNGFAVGRGRDHEKLSSRNNYFSASESRGAALDEAGSESSAVDMAGIPESNNSTHKSQTTAHKTPPQDRNIIPSMSTPSSSRVGHREEDISISISQDLADHNLSDEEEEDSEEDLAVEKETEGISIKNFRASKRLRL